MDSTIGSPDGFACPCSNEPKFKIERHEVAAGDGATIESSKPVFSGELFALDLNQVMAGDQRRRGRRSVESSKLAAWSYDQISKRLVRVKDLVDDDRAAGLLTSPASPDAKALISPLYRAEVRLPELYPGWEVGEMVIEKMEAYELVESQDDDAESGNTHEQPNNPF